MALGPISHIFYKLYLKKSCTVNGVLAHLWEANVILNIGFALTLCVCLLDAYASVIENKLLVF